MFLDANHLWLRRFPPSAFRFVRFPVHSLIARMAGTHASMPSGRPSRPGLGAGSTFVRLEQYRNIVLHHEKLREVKGTLHTFNDRHFEVQQIHRNNRKLNRVAEEKCASPTCC